MNVYALPFHEGKFAIAIIQAFETQAMFTDLDRARSSE
jgi:hypothetical protein